MVWPFSAVPDLFDRIRDAGIKVAIASSAKEEELAIYLEIAGISNLVDQSFSSTDADESKPAPDIFEAALKGLGVAAHEAIAIGDTPYDAKAAGKAGMQIIGVLSGSFTRGSSSRRMCNGLPGARRAAGLF
jgi:HAD superfamily hydrolase (TIGR01549 family)